MFGISGYCNNAYIPHILNCGEPIYKKPFGSLYHNNPICVKHYFWYIIIKNNLDLLYQSSPICVKQIIFGGYFKTFGSLYHNSPIHVKPIICHRTKKIIGTAYAGDHIPCQVGELGNQLIPPKTNRRNKSIGMENVWSRYHAKIGELGIN